MIPIAIVLLVDVFHQDSFILFHSFGQWIVNAGDSAPSNLVPIGNDWGLCSRIIAGYTATCL